MRKHPYQLFRALILTLLIPIFAYAEAPGPYEAVVSSSTLTAASAAVSSPIKSRKAFQRVAPISMRVRLREAGWVHFSFSKKRDRYWSVYTIGEKAVSEAPFSEAALLKGKATYRIGGQNASIPVTATVSQGHYGALTTILFSLPRRSSQEKTDYKVVFGPNHRSSVTRVPSRALNGKSCGLTADGHSSHVSAALSSAPATIATTYRQVAIAAIADYTYYNELGSVAATQLEIITNYNQAESIYQTDLGVTFNFDVNKIYIYTSSGTDPYTTANAETLLNTLHSSRGSYGSVDFYNLLTARNIYALDAQNTPEYNVIGLAYLGQVCTLNGYPYAVTERYSGANDYLIIAHEMGHSFGAGHDSLTSPTTIMAPYFPPSNQHFSAISQDEILVDYLTNHFYSTGQGNEFVTPKPNCLPNVSGGSPAPTPTVAPTQGAGTPAPGTPTPVPTSTPGSGGGGGGSGGVGLPKDNHIPTISVTGSLAKTGAASVSITFTDGIPDASCTSYLDVSEDYGFNTKKTKTKTLGAGDILSFSLQGTLATKAITTPGKKARAYLQVRYMCASASKTSSRITLRPDRIKSKKALSIAKWVKKFASSLNAAT